MEEARKSNMGQVAASPAAVKSVKLPTLVITKIGEELMGGHVFGNSSKLKSIVQKWQP